MYRRARATVRWVSAEEGRQRTARDVPKDRQCETETAFAQRQMELQEAVTARELTRHALDDIETHAPFAGRIGQRKVCLC